MKKLAIILVMVFASCNTSGKIEVSSLSDGRFITVKDSKALTIVGDTIVVRTSLKFGSDHLFGKYIGVVPDSNGMFLFRTAVRIK